MNPTLMLFAALFVGCGSLLVLHAAEPSERDGPRLTPELRARCLAVLRAGLASDEFWPAMHAAEALTLAGHGEEVVAALRDRLPVEQNDQRRCGLARELVRAGHRAALPTLFDILGNPQSTGRVHAAESLYKLGEIGDGKLLKAAVEQTEIAQLQLMAAAALAKSGDGAALAQLRALLQSAERPVRNNAAWALARLGDKSDAQAIATLLEGETDAASRGVFVNALACLGQADAKAELGRNLESPDPAVRTVAAEFAGHSGCIEHQVRLIKLLDDPNLDTRIRAAQSLLMLASAGGG